MQRGRGILVEQSETPPVCKGNIRGNASTPYDTFEVGVSMSQHGTGGNCMLSSFIAYNVSTGIKPPSV